jgi:hypothetical protein
MGRIAAALAAGASRVAHASGNSAEVSLAAVYDHDAVEVAIAQHRNVAFFAVEGELALNDASRRALVGAVERSGGLKGTARVALESAAVSVAYDPVRTTLVSLTAAANKPLAAKGMALSPLRIIDASGKLREP